MNTRHPSGNSDTESALESRLRELLARRILMLDGAMGTMIQRYKLSEADFRGERFADHPVDVRGNNDLLSLTRPDVVREIHQAYLEAGADLIETNTFGATSIAQQDYGLSHVAYDINLEAAKIAKGICTQYSTDEKPRFVLGALGPTPKTASISPKPCDWISTRVATSRFYPRRASSSRKRNLRAATSRAGCAAVVSARR